ncbi:MAG: hypothetical protein NC301_02420 [Bacteroides sp.]|nr:hypothetical protein [Bacteroides sp.]MCM1379586.1 hypothetical protein [Bacteroides sp.]MCM1446032.1 hypothetical protein [Prevotella sp.]
MAKAKAVEPRAHRIEATASPRVHKARTAPVLAENASTGVNFAKGTFERANLQTRLNVPQTKAAYKKVSMTKKSTHKVAKNVNAEASEGIEGDYTITIGDYYYGESSVGAYTADCNVSLEDGILVFKCKEFPTIVPALYDETTNKISFSIIPIGKVGNYYARFEPFAYRSHLNFCVL